MRVARQSLLQLARSASQITIFVGPFSRPRLGRQVLQAAQSVVLRNAHEIDRANLSIYFDREILASEMEAKRLHRLFPHLKATRILGAEDSKLRLGIQVADCVAHSFGQIVKAAVKGQDKTIDVGGPGSGHPEGTEAPLSWALLMSLRNALLTRPIAYQGEAYPPECDPVVLDPFYDDPVDFGQHPVLLGWGVQVLRRPVRASDRRSKAPLVVFGSDALIKRSEHWLSVGGEHGRLHAEIVLPPGWYFCWY